MRPRQRPNLATFIATLGSEPQVITLALDLLRADTASARCFAPSTTKSYKPSAPGAASI